MKNGELSRVAEALQLLTEGMYPDISDHQKDVADLCEDYGRYVGMDGIERETFVLAGHLHDAGKLLVPAYIIHKPARLTNVEMAAMHGHCDLAMYFLAPLGVDPRIADVIRQHHEDYDGGGYPSGLRGEEISPWARIVRALDSLAALIADRPYHQGISQRSALHLMRSQSERYDPEVLRTVFAMFNEPWGMS